MARLPSLDACEGVRVLVPMVAFHPLRDLAIMFETTPHPWPLKSSTGLLSSELST